MAVSARGIIASFISVLVGIILTPTIYNEAVQDWSANETANLTGTTVTVLAIVPIIFVVGIVYATVTGAI